MKKLKKDEKYTPPKKMEEKKETNEEKGTPAKKKGKKEEKEDGEANTPPEKVPEERSELFRELWDATGTGARIASLLDKADDDDEDDDDDGDASSVNFADLFDDEKVVFGMSEDDGPNEGVDGSNVDGRDNGLGDGGHAEVEPINPPDGPNVETVEPAINQDGPLPFRASKGHWGCSRCRWGKRGCITCRKWAIDGAHSYYADADGYITRHEFPLA